jgi:hypothetical protein
MANRKKTRTDFRPEYVRRLITLTRAQVKLPQTPRPTRQKTRTTSQTACSHGVMCRDLPVQRVRETCAMQPEPNYESSEGESIPIDKLESGNAAPGVSRPHVCCRFPQLSFACLVEKLSPMRCLGLLDCLRPRSPLLAHVFEERYGVRVISSRLGTALLPFCVVHGLLLFAEILDRG